jgi:hypothetical protein
MNSWGSVLVQLALEGLLRKVLDGRLERFERARAPA